MSRQRPAIVPAETAALSRCGRKNPAVLGPFLPGMAAAELHLPMTGTNNKVQYEQSVQ
jgi:hypothetical protein